jgi:hypothetical protein
MEKGLANLPRGKKIMKNTHAGRGPETKWEIPGNNIKQTSQVTSSF